MPRTDTIVIGAGQAGLAMSRSLGEWNHDHVVLERGRVGQRWRTERWDSLRLLTPNWQNRLPGYEYAGDDPDGFMAVPELIRHLEGYASSFDAPVEEETSVLSVRPRSSGWEVVTDQGTWQSSNVVIATGHCDRPHVPAMAYGLSPQIEQVTVSQYRHPDRLAEGGVLVVGASASGVQLADEIQRSGRSVTLAVGRHTRLPRVYRGYDIMWWLERLGSLNRSLARMPNRREALHEPSLQLIGRSDRRSIDLGRLHRRGVRMVGHLEGVDGTMVRFADDLKQTVKDADERLVKVLRRIDRDIVERGLSDQVLPVEPLLPIALPPGRRELDLHAEGIKTIVWATGYRRRYPWLQAPVLDRHGEIIQRRGRTPSPGLYVLGLQFMIRRRSAFIGGVGLDAMELAREIAKDPFPGKELAA